MTTATGAIPANTPYTGTLTYDDAQTAAPAPFSQGGYYATYNFTDITFTIGNTTITDGPGTIEVYNDVTTQPPGATRPLGDSLYINLPPSIMSSSYPTPSGPIDGVTFSWLFLGFVDITGTAFSSTALPSSINLASFTGTPGNAAFIEFNFAAPGTVSETIWQPITALGTGSTPSIPPSITTSSLPSGVYGVAYSNTVTDTTPNNDGSSISIAGLPGGLTATGGVISGTPTTVGVSSVNITATDQVTGLSSTVNLPLTINDAAINFVQPSLPGAIAGTAYTDYITPATGGTGSFTYSATNLPTGLTLSGTTISGTAPAAGSYNFTLTATDTSGTAVTDNLTLSVNPQTCSGTNAVESAATSTTVVVNGGKNILNTLVTTGLTSSNVTYTGGLNSWTGNGLIINYSGTVDPTQGCVLSSLSASPAVSISTTSLPNATYNTSYSTPINVAWGATPYQSISVSGLPAGISYSAGSLTGAPTAAPGNYSVTITVVDAVGATATTTLPLTEADKAISFSPALPAATVGTAYSAAISAIGGYGSFNYSASNLPAGLSLTGNVISGKPTTAGASNISLTATDAAGTVSQASPILSVNPAAVVTSCTAPAGSKSAKTIQANVSSVNGANVTIGNTVVTVPACAAITWNGNWSGLTKAIRVGYNVEVTKGYVVNGVTTATSLIVDNGL
ncbi:MAG: putative Ig domain-containing protein [Methylomonas sp.]